jgi:transcriptional regulator with XRE-family HTH domain
MVSTVHKQAVGSRLRMMIEAVNQRPADVARLFGVSASKIGNWMRGDDYPSEWFVCQFCDRFNLSADFLYRGRVAVSMEPSVADALWAAEAAFSPAPAAEIVPEPKKTAKPKSSRTLSNVNTP